MKAPQIILLTMWAIGLLIAANQHGKPQQPNNFWSTFFAAIIEGALLWWGGFWG